MSSPIKILCSTNIIPFSIQDSDIYFLLGLDSKYKEWASFGGMCKEIRGACKRQSTETLKKCLSRELEEESKKTIKIDDLEFDKCDFIHFVRELDHADIHNNLYFVQWKQDIDINNIITKFKDESFLTDTERKTKDYQEMEDINFIKLDKKTFGNYIYNTLQVLDNDKYRKYMPKSTLRQIDYYLGHLIKQYKNNKTYNTDKERIDPMLLLTLVANAERLNNNRSFKSIESLLDAIKEMVLSLKVCNM